jgi:DNA-binding NarL/FixJ family response regulator
MRVRVAIVEDNEEILGMLQRVIIRAPNLKCVCTCSSGEAALQMLPEVEPQVVVMDLRLPGMSGIECTARLKELMPQTQMLVYTVYGDNEQVFKALEAGASGYILKRSTHAEILQAIQDVHQGGAPMTGEIARKVVQSFRKKEPRDSERLTSREEEILGLLARGFVTKEIADQIGVSFDTVRFHLKNIYAKLHVHSRTEAVVKYLK